MRVAELAERFDVPYRDIRYVLEQGHLPKGVDATPGRGEHRELDVAQAFWLAVVLLVKQNGLRAPVAAQVADYVAFAVSATARLLKWDATLNPFADPILTEYEWHVDIGDMKYIRLVTDANPRGQSTKQEFPWIPIGQRKRVSDYHPLVTLRIDLSRLAAKLA